MNQVLFFRAAHLSETVMVPKTLVSNVQPGVTIADLIGSRRGVVGILSVAARFLPVLSIAALLSDDLQDYPEQRRGDVMEVQLIPQRSHALWIQGRPWFDMFDGEWAPESWPAYELGGRTFEFLRVSPRQVEGRQALALVPSAFFAAVSTPA